MSTYSRYVCANHLDQPVTPRGTGCQRCQHEQDARTTRRRRRSGMTDDQVYRDSLRAMND
jgi:hypothetical protein